MNCLYPSNTSLTSYRKGCRCDRCFQAKSVTDRPTKAHDVTGNAHARGNGINPKALANVPGAGVKQNASFSGSVNELVSSRNIRSVWEITTQPYPEAHFATFPEELARRCILAGCPEWVCGTCGKPRERIVDSTKYEPAVVAAGVRFVDESRGDKTRKLSGLEYNRQVQRQTTGWSDCGHGNYRAGVVLDPFLGSGTTALVVRKHGRACIGIELNPEYAALIQKRTQQLSLLAEGAA